MAVVAVSYTAQQILKIFPRCVNQLLMVTRLKIDIGKTGECLVEECLDTVSRAKWWYSTWFAIAEQFGEFVLGGKMKVPVEFLAQVLYLDPVTARHHDHGISGCIPDNDGLGDMVVADVCGYGRFVTGTRMRMWYQLVVNCLLLKISLNGLCNCHLRPPYAQFNRSSVSIEKYSPGSHPITQRIYQAADWYF